MHPDRLFIRKVQDLKTRSLIGTPTQQLAPNQDPHYEALMAAAPLRQLLMGDPPLMDVANRTRRLKLRFDVARRVEPLRPNTIFYGPGAGFDPQANMPGYAVERVGRDKLLRELMMYVHGRTITVRDLIEFTANAAVAIHYDNRAKRQRAVLAAVSEQLAVGGMDATVDSLLAVARVVVAGLEPLVARIESDYQGRSRRSPDSN
jgi:hypothetical protein